MHNTKNKLLSSIATLCVCFAMLIGSTYAWFTDTASTGVNKIQAGTLDVELLMWDNVSNSYVDISSDRKPIFGTGSIAQNNNSATLWEPGKTQVAYLAIKNAGNLDLKYKVGLNVMPVEKDLWKVMKYAITPDAKDGAGVSGWSGGNNVVAGQQIVSGSTDVSLRAGEIHYFALSVHMDEEADNTYQGGQVNFDMTVYAAQLSSENDSFGPSYDTNAPYPVSMVANITTTTDDTGATKVASAVTIESVKKVNVTEGGSSVEKPAAKFTIPAGVKLTNNTNSLNTSVEESSTPGNFIATAGTDNKTLDIKVSNVSSDNDTPIAVETYIEANLGSITLKHTKADGTVVTLSPVADADAVNNSSDECFYYNNSTGLLTLKSKTFSPFTYEYPKDAWEKHAATEFSKVIEGITYITNEAEMALFAKQVNTSGMANCFTDKQFMLDADLDLGEYLWTPIGQTGAGQFAGTFDGNGHTIRNLNVNNTVTSGDCSSGLFGWLNSATVMNLKIDTATVTGHHNVGVVAGYLETSGCTIENVHVTNATVSCTGVNKDANGDKCGGIVGHAGNAGVKVTNCTVTNSKISAGRDAGQVVGAALVVNVTDCSATNVTVTANGTSSSANIRNEVIGRIL